jgi:transposase-like protein
MIDGADKLLMEHRDRQVEWAAKYITELEAEIAELKQKFPPSCPECPLENICHVNPGWKNQLCLDAWQKLNKETT